MSAIPAANDFDARSALTNPMTHIAALMFLMFGTMVLAKFLMGVLSVGFPAAYTLSVVGTTAIYTQVAILYTIGMN